MLKLIAAAILAVAVPLQLQKARDACEADLSACAERDRLEQTWRHEQEAARSAAVERQRQEVQDDDARAAAADAELRKACGRDFHRLRVGMKFERVKKCSGLIFSAFAEDKSGIVYSAAGGFVRVERGVVVKWVAPSN